MLKIISDIPLLAEGLRRGMTILYPTDTIWGLGCSGVNDASVASLYAIKERDPRKSMLVLLPDDAPLLADPRLAELLLAPRPTTVIVPGMLAGLAGLAPSLLAGDGTIGVRIPRHAFCQALIKALGAPLVSTSANLSGEPSPSGYDTVGEEIKRRVDLIADPRYDTARDVAPSRIVKLREDGTLAVIRD